MPKVPAYKVFTTQAVLNIILGNIMLLYCVMFRQLSLYGLIFLFYIDIVVSAAFTLAKAERSKLNYSQQNDMKYAGELSYWDERKYRGKSEYAFAVGHIILSGLLFIFIAAIPLIAEGDDQRTILEFNRLFPFQSNWFWICVLVNIIQYSGLQFYYFKTKSNELEYFEDIIKFDYFKYWFFFSFMIAGACITALMKKEFNSIPLIGIVTYAILYIAMKTYLDIRDRKRHFIDDISEI